MGRLLLLLLLALSGRLAPARVGAPPSLRTDVVDHGPSDAAVDLVFLAEGYTAEEADQFAADVARLADEVLARPGAAFHSLFPFTNVRAVHVASARSGVPAGEPGDTAFGLFRDAVGPFRSILPSARSYRAAERACAEAAADFCVLLVNDDFYGGLGDEIAIVSASPTSGAIALRHELAHNFADQGEEYDAAEDYSGGNFAETTRVCQPGERPREAAGGRLRWPCIPWGHHLNQTAAEAPPQDAELLAAEWPWTELPVDARHAVAFATSARRPTLEVSFSVARAGTPGAVDVRLDGEPLRVALPQHEDRAFAVITLEDVPPGRHKLEFVGRKQAPLLCHVVVEALGYSPATAPAVGAYPVFAAWGELLGFRPTHRSCLMRDMTATTLCPVCRENVLLRLLQRVRFVYSVSVRTGAGVVELAVDGPETPQLEYSWGPLGSGRSVAVAAQPGCARLRAKLRSPDIKLWVAPETEQEVVVWVSGDSAELVEKCPEGVGSLVSPPPAPAPVVSPPPAAAPVVEPVVSAVEPPPTQDDAIESPAARTASATTERVRSQEYYQTEAGDIVRTTVKHKSRQAYSAASLVIGVIVFLALVAVYMQRRRWSHQTPAEEAPGFSRAEALKAL